MSKDAVSSNDVPFKPGVLKINKNNIYTPIFAKNRHFWTGIGGTKFSAENRLNGDVHL